MTAPGGQLPLRGVSVVEFAEGIAAPYATAMLAHLGADVVKVERADGDWLRHTARASFLVVNTAKRSVGVNLKAPGGLDVLWRLVARADVLVTNYRTPSLERLGLGVAALRMRAPKLVIGHLSAYSARGPMAGRGGTDTILQGVSAVMDQVGSEATGATRIGFPVVDLVAARDLAVGVLAALFERQLHGTDGRLVEISLFASASSLLLEGWQNTLLGKASPGRAGNLNAVHAPGGVYDCAAGSRLALIVLRDAEWPRLCAVLGLDDLAIDPELSTNDQRLARRVRVEPGVADALRRRAALVWAPLLEEAGIICGPVQSIDAVRSTPSLFDLVPIVGAAHEGGPVVATLTAPILVDGLDKQVPGAAALGAHTVEVLGELGFDGVQIEGLVASGAVTFPSPSSPAGAG